MSVKEIQSVFAEQSVSDVYRLFEKRGDKPFFLHTVILMFKVPTLSSLIYIGQKREYLYVCTFQTQCVASTAINLDTRSSAVHPSMSVMYVAIPAMVRCRVPNHLTV
jgi:hypothetical protein